MSQPAQLEGTGSALTTERTSHYTAVRRVLLVVLAVNLAVTALKIVLGIWSGALAVLADGFHSLVDSSSNLIGLAALRLASRPADPRHPYGYHRYETIGALAIGGLLLVAGYEIVETIIERILSGAAPEITPLALILVFITFPVNLFIVWWETRAGRRLNAELLLADATHTRTDLWVTGSVMVSLVGTWLGLAWLDLIVAGGVVILIVRAAFGIIRSTASTLTDAAALDSDQVTSLAREVPGVLFVHQVRSRGAPNAVFVDLHVKVHAGMSTEQAHAIASEVERRVVQEIGPVVDAVVHIEPARLDQPTEWERIAYDLRQVADGMGIGLHDLHVWQNETGGIAVEVHLELPAGITLRAAHDLAESFESRVKSHLPQPNTVLTHLEPIPAQVLGQHAPADENLEAEIRSWLTQAAAPATLLELQLHKVWEHERVAIRLALPGDPLLSEAHALAERVETALHARFPQVHRVVVHVEPA